MDTPASTTNHTDQLFAKTLRDWAVSDLLELSFKLRDHNCLSSTDDHTVVRNANFDISMCLNLSTINSVVKLLEVLIVVLLFLIVVVDV